LPKRVSRSHCCKILLFRVINLFRVAWPKFTRSARRIRAQADFGEVDADNSVLRRLWYQWGRRTCSGPIVPTL
jgi:hypothetical protein